MHHAIPPNETTGIPKPAGFCSFKLAERPFRIASWVGDF